MSKPLLAVPHRVESFAGACLPACLQMALAYFRISWSQERIASQIRHIVGAGTPAHNVTQLTIPRIRIRYTATGTLEDVQACLEREEVPILFVRTSELPYWDEDTAHAVLVVGLDMDFVFVHDPAFEYAPIPIPTGDFVLAWYELGNSWAAVARL